MDGGRKKLPEADPHHKSGTQHCRFIVLSGLAQRELQFSPQLQYPLYYTLLQRHTYTTTREPGEHENLRTRLLSASVTREALSLYKRGYNCKARQTCACCNIRRRSRRPAKPVSASPHLVLYAKPSSCTDCFIQPASWIIPPHCDEPRQSIANPRIECRLYALRQSMRASRKVCGRTVHPPYVQLLDAPHAGHGLARRQTVRTAGAA